MKKLCAIAAFVSMVLSLSCNNPTEVTVITPTNASVAGKVLPLGVSSVVRAIQGTVTKTDSCSSNGAFQIDNLKAGTCMLEVAAKNFGTYRGTVTLTAGGVNEVNDITLGKYPYPLRSASPSLQSQWNGIGTTISMSFALPMDTASVVKAFSMTPATPGIFMWSSDNTQLTFRPNATLRTSTAYTVSLDTSACTVDNSHVEFVFSYSFSTEPFRVVQSNPATGTTGYGLNQQAYFYFPAPVNAASVEKAVSVTPATAVDFTWSGLYLYVKPKSGYWRSGTQYTITVADSAMDSWGNPMASAYSLSFTTASAAVTTITPSDGQTAVSPSATVYLYFNTKVNKASVENAFSCKDSLDSLMGGTFSWSSDNTYFSFTPARQFKAGMKYSLRLDTTATDALGGKLPGVSSSFRTDVSKAVFSPVAGSANVSLNQQASISFNAAVNAQLVEKGIYAVPATDLSFSWNGNTVYIRPKTGYWGSAAHYTLVYKDSAAMPGDSLKTDFSTVTAGVSSVSPQDGQTGVSVSSGISISFTTSLNKPSAQSAFSCKDSLGSAVTGTFSWGSGSTNFSFTPSRQLKPGMKYTVKIDTTATDAIGGRILGITSSFTTDVARATMNPVTGSTNVSLTQQAYISFNNAVSVPAVEKGIYAVPSTDLSFTWGGNTVYIRPKSGYWRSNSNYQIVYKDSAAMPGDSLVTEFSTMVANISSMSPTDGQVLVALGSSVSVSFATRMNRTATENAFSCKDSLGSPLAGTFSWGGNYTSFTFTPSRQFTPNTRYTVKIDSTSTDALGGAVLGTTATFWTEAFRVTNIYPNAGLSGFNLQQQAYITFNSPCSTKSVEAGIYTVPVSDLAFTWSGTTVYIRPKSNYWGSNTHYIMVCRGTVKDINGILLKDSVLTDFTTIPASISQTQPTDKQESISLSTTISIYFSMGMSGSSLISAFSLKDSRDSLVPGTVSVYSTYMTFTPGAYLRPGTKYTVVLDSTAMDLNGGKMPRFTFGFTTEYLRVSYTNPQSGSNNFGTNNQGYIGFNTSADAVSTEKAISVSPATDLEFNWSGTYLYFKPRTAYWQSNTKYTVTVDTTAKDLYGGSLAKPYSFYFYTMPVRVSSYSPAYRQTGVDTTATVSITFNTPMDTAKTFQAIKLAALGSINVPGKVTGNNTSFTFSPDSALDTMTTYTVTVDTTAADVFGITMPASWSSMFTTKK